MRRTVLVTIFKFAFSYLEHLADKCLSLITRDATILLTYGVDEDMIDEITTMTDDFKNTPTDEELLGFVSIATENRDATCDQFKVETRSIMVRAKKAFGENSATYRQFGTIGLDEMDFDQLVRCGRRVGRTATLYFAKLAEKGLTQDMLDDYALLVAKFDDEVDKKDDAVAVRDKATEDRIILANNLYSKIIEVFEYGKNYWVNKSEAYYNDYIIYNTKDGQQPVEEEFGDAHGLVKNTVSDQIIVGAEVVLEGVDGPIVSNSSGVWTGTHIPTSTVSITCTKSGFNNYQAAFNVVAGEDITFDISMTPSENPPPPDT